MKILGVGKGIGFGGILPFALSRLRGLQVWFDSKIGVESDSAIRFSGADKSLLETSSELSYPAVGTVISFWANFEDLREGDVVFKWGRISVKVVEGAYGPGSFALTLFEDGQNNDPISYPLSELNDDLQPDEWALYTIWAGPGGYITYINNFESSSSDQTQIIPHTGVLLLGNDASFEHGITGFVDSFFIFNIGNKHLVNDGLLALLWNAGSGATPDDFTEEQRTFWGGLHAYALSENNGGRFDAWGGLHLGTSSKQLLNNASFDQGGNFWTANEEWIFENGQAIPWSSAILFSNYKLIYFFDPSDADSLTIVDPEAATKLVSSWSNAATGSNAVTPLALTQSTSNDQPVWDGASKITFADTSDFLAFDPAAITQGGWLVVGTSLGTFSYRINANALTNVNLLGRVAFTSTPGDLYGMMLIPAESGQFVIDQARQRFINAGAVNGVVGTSVLSYWRDRSDIVEFGFVDTSGVTTFQNAWQSCSSLTSFPLLDVSSGTIFNGAWFACSGLTSFPILDFSAGTSFRDVWQNCSGLTTFPLVNVSNGTDFANCWNGCSSLTSFPQLDVSKGINFLFAFRSLSSLTSFPLLDVSSGTLFNSAWNGCSGLTSFPLLDVSSGTNFSSAWSNCTGLTSFPLLNVSSGTNFQFTWNTCSSLTSFPLLDVSSGSNFTGAWRNCPGLTSFPLLDVSSGTNFVEAWLSCSGLTSFPLLDVSSGTNFQSAWRTCSGLTSFPLLDVSSGTNFLSAWFNCPGLTSFPLLNVSSGTNFADAWRSCSNLTTFPANFFDGCAATNFTNAFNTTNLSEASIDGILVSIESNGTSNGTFNQTGGSAPSATGEAAINELRDRGWTVTVTGGY
jgi:hypothetical protein